MTRLPSRLRGPIIALAVLAVSAGVASAARPEPSTPDAAADGLERARNASGLDVPIAGPPTVEVDVPDTTVNDPVGEADEPSAGAPAEHPENHGADVVQAAQADTPAEFENHGQYVKSVATDNHGHDPERTTGKDRAAEVKANR
jgi:hypothetical protein